MRKNATNDAQIGNRISFVRIKYVQLAMPVRLALGILSPARES